MDQITICNMALGLLGDTSKSRRMTTMSRTGTQIPTHHVILDFYDDAKDRMLAVMDWRRARKVKALTVSADDPVPSNQWTFKYVRPPDALIVRAILDTSGTEYDWEDMHEERIADNQTFNDEYIYTDLDDALCRYTFRAGEERYLPGMAKLHALYLAEDAAMSVIGDEKKALLMTQRLQLRSERLCKSLGAKEGYVPNEKGSHELTDLYG